MNLNENEYDGGDNCCCNGRIELTSIGDCQLLVPCGGSVTVNLNPPPLSAVFILRVQERVNRETEQEKINNMGKQTHANDDDEDDNCCSFLCESYQFAHIQHLLEWDGKEA